MASEEPATKKAKTGEESYYKVIDGVRYDRALLEAAEGFAADGQVGYPEARKLWKNAQDGAGVTDIEKATLEYAMKVYKFSEPARKFMTTYLAAGKHRSYYKTVSNVQYDRALLEAAEKAAADGQISWREAKQLLEDASDGKGMTGTEKATLEYALKTFKFTDKARKFLEGGLRVEKPASYPDYRSVGGKKFDHALLLEFEEAAKDGVISKAEAQRLWDVAQDGKGVTEIERATLKHALDSGLCTGPAKALLEEKLGLS
ncbi:unnamed protein product [Prorocentrum cordatum]|nr:unnamed protein product [Polarella glacialis]